MHATFTRKKRLCWQLALSDQLLNLKSTLFCPFLYTLIFPPGQENAQTKKKIVVFEKFYFFLFFSISYNNTDVTEYIVLQTQSTPPPPPPWLLLP